MTALGFPSGGSHELSRLFTPLLSLLTLRTGLSNLSSKFSPLLSCGCHFESLCRYHIISFVAPRNFGAISGIDCVRDLCPTLAPWGFVLSARAPNDGDEGPPGLQGVWQ